MGLKSVLGGRLRMKGKLILSVLIGLISLVLFVLIGEWLNIPAELQGHILGFILFSFGIYKIVRGFKRNADNKSEVSIREFQGNTQQRKDTPYRKNVKRSSLSSFYSQRDKSTY
jgi:hypothetical protein